ncbi:hypothetical protein BKH46_08050 [Helicobacter sp. 12S02634-8]|uniref:hypothetical protein n=1 Tax=Helicobacter sp. 12S02634-8 TaxID=1476199 RepID=UPI000BA688C2|nr:hypothetical protein [Helicobacter sp. 12S02634-8]PAF46329.1 hypothetical protein BKH46_08050 [Helicobacter sp. 12S02634-8]
MKNKTKFFIGIASMLFLLGCSSREIVVLNQQDYQSRYKPIIGSQNNDARTVIDYGVVLKIWISPYKDRYGVLIAGHDNYVWVRRPDFVPGSTVPQVNQSSGVITPTRKLPFSISPREIDRADLKSDKVINDFINESYKNTNNRVMNKIKKDTSNIKNTKAKTKQTKTAPKKTTQTKNTKTNKTNNKGKK